MKRLPWLDVLLGVWLVAFPIVVGYSEFRLPAVAENLLPGIFLIVTSGLILAGRTSQIRGDWLQELCGLWLLVGSIVWTVSGGSQAALNSLIVGLLVLAIDVADTLRLTRRPDAIA